MELIDAETEFFSGLIELQYGQNVEKKLSKISKKISWAKNWPEDKKSFWNAEAFMWQRKINQKIRKIIKEEITFLNSGKNLDLGCGSYSYMSSVGFDISEKMLIFNENCFEKIVGDLEKRLPFEGDSFNSITAIFVLNYVRNYQQLLQEIKRIIQINGVFMFVLYSKEINSWQRRKEVNLFSEERWKEILTMNGFKVDFFGLWVDFFGFVIFM